MLSENFYLSFCFVLRWVHILAALVWVGLLYFLSFVYVPTLRKTEPTAHTPFETLLIERTFTWLRWGAMITFLAGWTLLLYKYSATELWVHYEGEGLSGRAQWILFGITLGTLMWFSTWFLLWPLQRKRRDIASSAGNKAHVLDRIFFMALKGTTYLSGPLLFGMIAPNNYGTFNLRDLGTTTLAGIGVIYGLFYLADKPKKKAY